MGCKYGKWLVNVLSLAWSRRLLTSHKAATRGTDMATKSLEKHLVVAATQSHHEEAGSSAWLSANAITGRNEVHGLATLSQALVDAMQGSVQQTR